MNLINIIAATDLCTSQAGYRLFGLAGYALKFIQIAVPIILILMGTIDLVKALVAQKDDQMKKAQNTLMKRAIIGVVIFFVPMIVNFLMGMVNNSLNSPCITSFFDPKSAIATANRLKENSSGGSVGSSANCNSSDPDTRVASILNGNCIDDSIDLNSQVTER